MGYETLVAEIGRMKKLLERSMPVLRKEVDLIISSRVGSVQRIEMTLDSLLGFVPWGLGETEFKRLNRYYAGIHRENAAQYSKFYDEAIAL
ncbi:MAG TPA: hypothetical protein HA362_03635 [Nanoarchaeota archaeon]|nr:hypothetical protein [Nanoarchaeota archaeon]